MNEEERITIDDASYPKSTVKNVYALMEILNHKISADDFDLLRQVVDDEGACLLLSDVLTGAVILEDPG